MDVDKKIPKLITELYWISLFKNPKAFYNTNEEQAERNYGLMEENCGTLAKFSTDIF